MRAALLIRVSTAAQATEDRHSIPVQREEMTAYAARQGNEVVAEFPIPGESAWKWNIFERPEFAKVMEAAKRGEFDALYSLDSSRIARNQAVLHDTRRQLRELGIQLWSVAGDYNVVEDGQRAGFEAIIAEQHSDGISRRVRQSYKRRHELGLPTGFIPFGYRNEGPTRPPSVVEEEREAIRELFRLRVQGKGFKELARYLNLLGLKPRSQKRTAGSVPAREAYTHFTPSAVQGILENDFYAGFIRHHGERSVGAHEAIISEAEWAAAQEKVRHDGPKTRNVRLLAGIATCARCCDGNINVHTSGPKNMTPWYRHTLKGECPPNPPRFKAEEAEAQVEEALLGMFADFEWSSSIEVRTRRVEAVPDDGQREALLEQRKRASHAYVAGGLEEPEYKALLADLNARLEQLPTSTPEEVVFAGRRFTEWGAIWAEAETPKKREILREFFSEVVIDLMEKKVYLKPHSYWEELFRDRRTWVYEGGEGPHTFFAHTRFPGLIEAAALLRERVA